MTSPAGRGRSPIPVTVFGARPDAAELEQYSDAGADRCVFWLPSASRDEDLPRLAHIADLCSQVVKDTAEDSATHASLPPAPAAI